MDIGSQQIIYSLGNSCVSDHRGTMCDGGLLPPRRYSLQIEMIHSSLKRITEAGVNLHQYNFQSLRGMF